MKTQLSFTQSFGHCQNPTIITTNLSFDRWREVINDTVLVAALVDRLTHKAHLVNMNGDSYRFKETKALLNAN